MNDYTFKEYSQDASLTACYPPEQGVTYCMLGLGGELGEIMNKYKKTIRGDYPLDEERKSQLLDELGDVCWYGSQLAKELGSDWATVHKNNIHKLHSRHARGVIKGDGDKR